MDYVCTSSKCFKIIKNNIHVYDTIHDNKKYMSYDFLMINICVSRTKTRYQITVGTINSTGGKKDTL